MSLAQFKVGVQTLVEDDIPEQYKEPDTCVDIGKGYWQILCRSANGVITLLAYSIDREVTHNMLDYGFLRFLEKHSDQGPSASGTCNGIYFQMNWTN